MSVAETPAAHPFAFPATLWSRVLRTRDDAQSHAAIEDLCAVYWQPVLAYVTMLGCGGEAEDVTQEFFANFLRREGFQNAAPERGRLRAYLKTAIRHHVAHWWRDRSTQRRGGGRAPLSLDGDDLPELPAPADADAHYDTEWALAILERALARLREGYVSRNRAEVYEQLKPTLLGSGHVDRTLAVEQHRARRRLADLLRREVADTVDDPAEIEAELLHLLRTLAETPFAS